MFHALPVTPRVLADFWPPSLDLRLIRRMLYEAFVTSRSPWFREEFWWTLLYRRASSRFECPNATLPHRATKHGEATWHRAGVKGCIALTKILRSRYASCRMTGGDGVMALFRLIKTKRGFFDVEGKKKNTSKNW